MSQASSGLPANRVEALSDGVFSIAMTVLILGIAVPDGGGGEELAAHLQRLWPKFASYALSFVMLGVLWIGHHFQFHYIRRTDRPLLWLNLLFLLAVTFLPFATGVLGNYYRSRLAVLLYGSTLATAGAFLLAHWIYASAGHRLVPQDIHDEVLESFRTRIARGLVAIVIATALALIDTRASLVVFLVLPVAYVVGGRADRHVGKQT